MRIYLYILLGSFLAAPYGVSCKEGDGGYKALKTILKRLATATDEWTGGGFDSPDKQLDDTIKLAQAIAPLFGVNAEVLSMAYLFMGDGSSVKDPVINFMRQAFKKVNAKIDILKDSIETLGEKITWEIYTEQFADLERALSRSETYVTEFLDDSDNNPDKRTLQRLAAKLHDHLSELDIYTGVEKLYSAAVMESSVFGGNLFDLYYNYVKPDCSSITMFGRQLTSLLFRGAWYSEIYRKLSQDLTKSDWGHRIYRVAERVRDAHLNCLYMEVNRLPLTINSLANDTEVKPDISLITTTLNNYLQPIEIFMMEKPQKGEEAIACKGMLFQELTLKNYDMTILYTYTAADGLVDEDVKQAILTEIQNTPVVDDTPELLKTLDSLAENENVQLLAYFGYLYSKPREINHHPEPDINVEASYTSPYTGKTRKKTFFGKLAVEPVYKPGYNCDECERNLGKCQTYPHINKHFCRCPFNTEGINCEKSLSRNDEQLEAILNIIEAYKVPTLMVDVAFVIDESKAKILDSIENIQNNIQEGLGRIIDESYFLKYIEDVDTLKDMAVYAESYLKANTESTDREFFVETFLSILSECSLMDIKDNFKRYLDASDTTTSMIRRYTKEIENNDTPVCSEEYAIKIHAVRFDMFRMQELIYTLLMTEYSIKEQREETEEGKQLNRNLTQHYQEENKNRVEEQWDTFAKSSCPPMKNIENLVDNNCTEYDFLTGYTVTVSCSSGYAAVAPDGSCISSVTCDETNTINHEDAGWEIECVAPQEGDFNFDVEVVEDDQFTISRSTADKFRNTECLTFGVKYKLQNSPTWNTPIQDKTARSWTFNTTLLTISASTYLTYEFELEVYLNDMLLFTKSTTKDRRLNKVSKGDECRYDLECNGSPGLVCRGDPRKCICDTGYYDRPTECISETIMQSWDPIKRGGYDGVNGGKWGPYVECAINQYVFAIKLRAQMANKYTKDDKGITDIRMYCAPYGGLPEKTNPEEKYSIKSIGADDGTWQFSGACNATSGEIASWRIAYPVVAMEIRAEEHQPGLKDDEGVTQLEVRCQDDYQFTPEIKATLSDVDGTWQVEESCNDGEALVGFQTRIQDTFNDEHGVSGFRWFCRRYK